MISKKIRNAKKTLIDKINNLDVMYLDISDYNKRYLGIKKNRINAEIDKFGDLLVKLLKDEETTLSDYLLVDYGGGCGLMTYLALEVGIQKIIYVDIFKISCDDVKILSEALGYNLEHIICGEERELIEYLNANKNLSVDGIISYDVLEHIYDLEKHFKNLSDGISGSFKIIYGSGANPKNPRNLYTLRKKQIEAETNNRDVKWGNKETISNESYISVRKKIILEHTDILADEDVDQLALATRGLIQKDILKQIDLYLDTKELSYEIQHTTNTCDPISGSWCEHLIDFNWLLQVMKDNRYAIEILPGSYYDNNSGLLYCILKKVLNIKIKLLGKAGLYIAPFYIVQGVRNSE